ncbi:LANO_0D00540g1_1 [Lachancea nothofagi CBS 11611]|uniref:Coatomer subunit delta n=1 Tax=Lachancea nothofagi CBS 11611 TaxID=1266666 RepID=A0A1G4JD21_9SACH|nr:LANO_0D00540g1_1 [Lachancea nothofagi CBS 11611]
MVVIAVSIITRQGKPLLSRQFRDISKDRVTELLSNFQGLVANSSSQHTFVEDEHVRYVYKPFDDYYIILITNRQSNIIQDLDTLKLFAQIMNSYLSSFDEHEIFENAFEILSSFDEVITMGYKENLSMAQINTYLSMESHEEKIQEIIERNKEFEAAEDRKRRAKEISRKEQERKMGIPSMGLDAMRFQTSNDPNLSNAYSSYYSQASPAAQQSYYHTQQKAPAAESPAPLPMESSLGGKGMKLGGARRSGLGAHVAQLHTPARQAVAPVTSSLQVEEPEKTVNNGILVSVKEVVSAQISREGNVESSELKGSLELRVNNQQLAHARLALDSNIDAKDKSFQFKTHPNIDKNLFLTSAIVGLRDQKKAFPFNDQSLAVLRWRKVGAVDDSVLVPLQISSWVSPSESDQGMFDVTFELEMRESYNESLNDLRFALPVFTENVRVNDEFNDLGASIESIDDENGVVVKIETIEPQATATFSLTVEAEYEDALFPVSVLFSNHAAHNSFSGIKVSQVVSSNEESEELPFDAVASLRTEEYTVV